MKSTYGVLVFQEQVMQIATDLAGFSKEEADTLRKAIGKKIKELMDKKKGQFIEGMGQNGISEKLQERYGSG